MINTIIDLAKNPIVIGILVAVLVYLFLWWQEKKRLEKNPNSKRKKINFIIPIVLGGMSWFISSFYFNNSAVVKADSIIDNLSNVNNVNNIGGNIANKPNINNNLLNGNKQYIINSRGSINSDNSLGSASYHIIGKNDVKYPGLDVFLDIAQF